MSHKPTRRRFIAGAVCPRCAQMDKIVVDLDSDTRHCVSCGFSEDRPQENSASGQGSQAKEVLTRVTRPSSRLVETPAQAVTLIDPRKEDTRKDEAGKSAPGNSGPGDNGDAAT